MKFSRALVLSVAIGSLALSSSAFAQEEDDDGSAGMTFEQKLIHQFMTGLGATNGRGNSNIKYRERSPLVLPPSANLPTPQPAARNAAPANWPKDPEEVERRALASAKRQSPEEASRPLMPSELAKGRTGARRGVEQNPQPGAENPGRALKPNELGYRGGLFGSILTPQKEEAAPFTGEPERATLTDPPTGYQTPSPNFAYGVGQDYKNNQKRPGSGQDPARGSN